MGLFLHFSRTCFPCLQNEEIAIPQGLVGLNKFKYVKHLPQGRSGASYMVTYYYLSLSMTSMLSCSLMPSLHQTSLFMIPSACPASSRLYAFANSISSFCPDLCLLKSHLNFMAQLKCCFLQEALPDSQPKVFFASS